MNGGIGLNVAFIGRQLKAITLESGDDAKRDGVTKTIRVANRHNDIANFNRVRIRCLDSRETCQLRFKQSKISIWVNADYRSTGPPTIR